MYNEMKNEMKLVVHDIIENATQALRRNDRKDEHWKVLLSLLRYKAEEYLAMFQEFEKGEEE